MTRVERMSGLRHVYLNRGDLCTRLSGGGSESGATILLIYWYQTSCLTLYQGEVCTIILFTLIILVDKYQKECKIHPSPLFGADGRNGPPSVMGALILAG